MTDPQTPDLIPADAEVELPLSVLIDQFAGDQPRDRELVRRFARWWGGRSTHIRLKILDSYITDSVLIAFQMHEKVRMLVTGWIPDQPVELTFKVEEDDFPHLMVVLSAEASAPRSSLASVDYGCRGQEFALAEDHEGVAAGAAGVAECLMEVDGLSLLRGTLSSGEAIQLPADRIEWLL